MNIFKNKYFLLGNLAFLLLAIPVVLFFVKNQTSTRGSAAPTTTMEFIDPNVTTDQCTDDTERLVLNPGQNIVATVELSLKWDKSKFDVVFEPNQTAFPQTLKGPKSTAEGMTITLNIGSDVTKALTTTTDVGKVTIKPLAPTNGVVDLTIDATETKVYSLSQQDGAVENVYNASGSHSLPISITAKSCDASATPSPSTTTQTQTSPSPTTTSGATPTTVPSAAPTAAPTTAVSSPTPSPTVAAANQSPVCLNLSSSASSGSAPLSVTLTAGGQDTNGTISKATFNFGDGTQQDVTNGLGTASVSAQIAHTYTSGGNFTATSVFTDNQGAVSSTCSQQIAVTGAFATIAPTATPTLAPITTSAPTATPTIADTGVVSNTVGLITGIVLVIVVGIFLLAL